MITRAQRELRATLDASPLISTPEESGRPNSTNNEDQDMDQQLERATSAIQDKIREVELEEQRRQREL